MACVLALLKIKKNIGPINFTFLKPLFLLTQTKSKSLKPFKMQALRKYTYSKPIFLLTQMKSKSIKPF